MTLILLITLQKQHVTMTVKMWWFDGAKKQVLACHSKLHQSHLLQKKHTPDEKNCKHYIAIHF